MATGRIPINGTAAIQETIVDAKGDLIVATGADAVARLAVGTNGHTLVANSSETTGLEWVAPAGGGGKVLQVVSSVTTTPVTIATTSYVDTGITATISPTLATSKVLVILDGRLIYKRFAHFQNVGIDLLRGATVIADFSDEALLIKATGSTFVEVVTHFSTNFLDSPATTSAITYKVQARIGSTADFGTSTWQELNGPSVITLLEIGV